MPTIGLTVEEIDIFQFVNQPFQINIQLTDVNTNSVHTGETSCLKVLLAFEGNASIEHRCKEHHPNLIEVVQNHGIQLNGKAQIWVKLNDVSMNYDNQRFVIYVEAYRPQGENNVIAAITNPFTSIRNKLVIFEANTTPYIWYKDEGAKDKCIKVLVKLIDSDKNVVGGRVVPLVVSLIYSSGQAVQPSTVLTLFQDKDKPLSIGPSGSALIKFRVNEVSRNHRKQMFHLLVTPDTREHPELGDISPATSVAFEVKSKRTSDARKEVFQGINEDLSEDAHNFPGQLAKKHRPNEANLEAVGESSNPAIPPALTIPPARDVGSFLGRSVMPTVTPQASADRQSKLFDSHFKAWVNELFFCSQEAWILIELLNSLCALFQLYRTGRLEQLESSATWRGRCKSRI